MKSFWKFVLLIIAIFFLLGLITINAAAQDEQDNLPDDATARKIFYTYNAPSNSPVKSKGKPIQKNNLPNTTKQGSKGKSQNSSSKRKKPLPGAQVKIELERNGVTQFVPPNTVFYSGDKVRFYFKVNFPAYVAVINQGSSGKVSLLFPCSGQKNLIQPQTSFKIPTGNFSFKFDENAGEENLTFVMSSSTISIVDQAIAEGADVCSQKLANNYQAKFDELNTNSVGEGRDIVLAEDEDNDGTKAAYFLTSLEKLKKTIGLKFRLIHK